MVNVHGNPRLRLALGPLARRPYMGWVVARVPVPRVSVNPLSRYALPALRGAISCLLGC